MGSHDILTSHALHRANHVITFLRPKPGQSPTTATFEVPLTFNKLDFRDYLYHLYNVETTSVRSFINQRMPAQKAIGHVYGGQWYRPRAQKLMIVDLVKPFTWPERPAEKDMDPWDHKLFRSMEDGQKADVDKAVAVGSWGPQKMRTDEAPSRERIELRKMAEELLAGKQQWTPGLQPLQERQGYKDMEKMRSSRSRKPVATRKAAKGDA